MTRSFTLPGVRHCALTGPDSVLRMDMALFVFRVTRLSGTPLAVPSCYSTHSTCNYNFRLLLSALYTLFVSCQ